MKFNAKYTHQIINYNTQYALQASSQNDKKYQVQLGPPNSQNKRQLWLLEGRKQGNFQVINGFTDQVLTQNGQDLILKRGASNKHQIWFLQFVTEQQFYIRLAKTKQTYICVEGGGRLIFKQCKSLAMADKWILKPVTDNQVLNKSCFIMSTDTKKLIDVPQFNRNQGSHILIYEPNYRYNQRWNIYRAGQIYVIKSYFNQMNLDVYQQKFDHHTQVVQWPSHGNLNQFWMFEKVGDSVYRISTFYDKQLQLGHHHAKLVLHRGRKFTWIVQGFFPE